MKKISYLFFAAVLFTTACKKNNDPPPPPPPTPETPTAKVNFTNATLNAGTLGIKINDTALTTVTSLGFLASSGYMKTSFGSATKISFIYPNTNTLFDDTTVSLAANSNYSAFIGGEIPGNTCLVFTGDNLTAPASGKAKVRLVNLSADDYHLNFYVGGPILESDVQYKEVTPFYEVTAGTLNIIVQDPDSVGYQRTLNGQVLADGKIYTIMFTGKTGSLGDADLKLTVINNN